MITEKFCLITLYPLLFTLYLFFMPSVYIKTYGCQMNERDSEQVARDLVAHGYTIAPHEKEADVILLNTCSVREMAESKAIGKMGFLKKNRRLKPQRRKRLT